jgi:formimidoylglutamate deiminase
VTRLFAPVALLPGGWAFDVLIEVEADGNFGAVTPQSQPGDAEVLSGAVIPGMPNVHSKAFQRALAGRTERRATKVDTFLTWRQMMYKLVDRINPEQFEAIATYAFIEMLKAGYTAVGEFHYLHNAPGGTPYDRPAELSERLIAAAKNAGIGMTLLLGLYCYSNFAGKPPMPEQLRFVLTLEKYLALWNELHTLVAGDPQLRLGAAPHSLRAVGRLELSGLVVAVITRDPDVPIHMLVSEQRFEVESARMAFGMAPIEYLFSLTKVNARWCLIHATHATRDEITLLGGSGAVVCLCPTTEANLGDGIFPTEILMARGGRFAIGSDTNVTIDAAEELRWMEYGQRLTTLRRAVLSSKAYPSAGEFMYRTSLASGAQALGRRIGVIEMGARADLVVLDDFTTLDMYVFSMGRSAVADVMVGGTWVVRDHAHPAEEEARTAYQHALDALTRT